MKDADLADLRFDDMMTFLAVGSSGSISGAARTQRVTPSHVSKAIKRLESHLRVKLLVRGARGVTLSVTGERLKPQLEEIVRRVGGLRDVQLSTEVTVAAPSFLNALFLPRIARTLAGRRVCGLELPPALVREYATENLFDLALTMGQERFPGTWESSLVGPIAKGLFASPAIARSLGHRPVAVGRLLELPFVVPIYHHNGRFVIGDEGCPIARERRVGHVAQTIWLALELAVHTGHLVFGPKIAAARHIQRGELVEIAVKGWDVQSPLYIACNGERTLATVRSALVAGLRAELARLSS